jgi:hypothetical protein
MIHHRVIPRGESKEDSIAGFGIDTDHYIKVRHARLKYNEENPEDKIPTHLDFTERYDIRTGFYIDGTKIETKRHHYHDYHLVEKETGTKYHIDLVCVDYHYGKYLSFMTRKDGTQSHGQSIWELMGCNEPDILARWEKAHSRFELVKNEE